MLSYGAVGAPRKNFHHFTELAMKPAFFRVILPGWEMWDDPLRVQLHDAQGWRQVTMRKLRMMVGKAGGVEMEIEDADLIDSTGCLSFEGADWRWLR